MPVSRRNIIIFGILLNLQQVLSEQFSYSKKSLPQYKDIEEGFTIELGTSGGNCCLDLHLSKNLTVHDFIRREQVEDGPTITRPTRLDEVEECHYIGKIRGMINSWIAVTTCEGFSGVIYNGRESYNITSNESWDGDAMVSVMTILPLSRKENTTDETRFICPKCATADQNRMAHASNPNPSIFEDAEYYVEVMLMVDWSWYLAMQSNMTRVHRRCKDIINIVNAFYQEFKLFVAIVAINVWSLTNEANVIPYNPDNFNIFANYAVDYLYHDHVDCVALLTNLPLVSESPSKNISVALGAARGGKMCTSYDSLFMVYDGKSQWNYEVTARIFAHELAHSLGVTHDNEPVTKTCACKSGQCIMWSPYVYTSHWSSCTTQEINRALKDEKFPCLKNKPARPFSITTMQRTHWSVKLWEFSLMLLYVAIALAFIFVCAFRSKICHCFGWLLDFCCHCFGWLLDFCCLYKAKPQMQLEDGPAFNVPLVPRREFFPELEEVNHPLLPHGPGGGRDELPGEPFLGRGIPEQGEEAQAEEIGLEDQLLPVHAPADEPLPQPQQIELRNPLGPVDAPLVGPQPHPQQIELGNPLGPVDPPLVGPQPQPPQMPQHQQIPLDNQPGPVHAPADEPLPQPQQIPLDNQPGPVHAPADEPLPQPQQIELRNPLGPVDAPLVGPQPHPQQIELGNPLGPVDPPLVGPQPQHQQIPLDNQPGPVHAPADEPLPQPQQIELRNPLGPVDALLVRPQPQPPQILLENQPLVELGDEIVGPVLQPEPTSSQYRPLGVHHSLVKPPPQPPQIQLENPLGPVDAPLVGPQPQPPQILLENRPLVEPEDEIVGPVLQPEPTSSQYRPLGVHHSLVKPPPQPPQIQLENPLEPVHPPLVQQISSENQPGPVNPPLVEPADEVAGPVLQPKPSGSQDRLPGVDHSPDKPRDRITRQGVRCEQVGLHDQPPHQHSESPKPPPAPFVSSDGQEENPRKRKAQDSEYSSSVQTTQSVALPEAGSADLHYTPPHKQRAESIDESTEPSLNDEILSAPSTTSDPQRSVAPLNLEEDKSCPFTLPCSYSPETRCDVGGDGAIPGPSHAFGSPSGSPGLSDRLDDHQRSNETSLASNANRRLSYDSDSSSSEGLLNDDLTSEISNKSSEFVTTESTSECELSVMSKLTSSEAVLCFSSDDSSLEQPTDRSPNLDRMKVSPNSQRSGSTAGESLPSDTHSSHLKDDRTSEFSFSEEESKSFSNPKPEESESCYSLSSKIHPSPEKAEQTAVPTLDQGILKSESSPECDSSQSRDSKTPPQSKSKTEYDSSTSGAPQPSDTDSNPSREDQTTDPSSPNMSKTSQPPAAHLNVEKNDSPSSRNPQTPATDSNPSREGQTTDPSSPNMSKTSQPPAAHLNLEKNDSPSSRNPQIPATDSNPSREGQTTDPSSSNMSKTSPRRVLKAPATRSAPSKRTKQTQFYRKK